MRTGTEGTVVTTSRPVEQDAGHRGGRAVVLFMFAGLVAVLLIGILVFGVARRTAVSESVRNARDLTLVDERSVSIALTDQIVTGDVAAVARLDSAVRSRVLSRRVVRVKVWTGDGRIVYADDPILIGQRFDLGDDELNVLRKEQIAAEVSDLSRLENREERRYGKLLEVYLGTRTLGGTPLLFETYLRYDSVAANGRRLVSSFAPAFVGGLLVLWLVQLPLAVGLTRRISAGHRRERDLLTRAVESSDRERRRIAADLHDSVVQGLVGSSMTLAATAIAMRQRGPDELADAVDGQAGVLRQWVRELRTLLVSIAPPKLHEQGLAAAFADLASAARARGLVVDVDVPAGLQLGRTAEALVFRAAQEALRNTVVHAAASTVSLRVEGGDGTVALTVEDDGVGFDPSMMATRQADGHVGLVLLEQLVVDADGSLTVERASGDAGGTVVTVRLPTR